MVRVPISECRRRWGEFKEAAGFVIQYFGSNEIRGSPFNTATAKIVHYAFMS
jgi:hypothetical protein